MRASKILAPTLRETPAEAEVISHQLLMRAGFMRRSAAGVYTYLPLGIRVLKKIKEIIREEMDQAGAQEILMPILQPAELWHESGRWSVYGDELFRLKDRHGRDFALSPTHEELVTDVVRQNVRSYKDLPLNLYQIQNKYRDERRPRFGLMRGREFVMKDAYSFDRDEKALEESYRIMYQTYERIFNRCGLDCRPVEADAGAIGGTGGTHEFMVLAEAGEGAVVYCSHCSYAANVEKAEAVPAQVQEGEALPLEKVATPDQKTIDEVSQFLGVPTQATIKALIYKADEKLVAVLIRGDREVNEIKLSNVLGGPLTLLLATDEEVAQVSPGGIGYVGPVGLSNIEILADQEVMAMVNGIAGANEKGYHVKNVNPGRDFSAKVYDLRLVGGGEPCPKCSGTLVEARGIEVGQVFKLGTKYSEALGATFLDEKGEEKPMVMGCYGIGVSRTMAASIEQHNDNDGIIWPMAIAPFQVTVVPVNTKDEAQVALAEGLYQELQQMGVEVLLDDRNERPGVKFKDADLIGFPLRVTVGNKSTQEKLFEVKVRATGEQLLLPREELIAYIQKAVRG
jgi:prolyl-tRNA synthetase